MDAKQDEISLIGHKLVYAKNIVAPGQLNVLMKLATQGCFYGVTVQYRTTSAIGWWEGRLGKIISMLFKQTSWNQTWLLLCLFTKHGCNVGIRASKIVCLWIKVQKGCLNLSSAKCGMDLCACVQGKGPWNLSCCSFMSACE